MLVLNWFALFSVLRTSNLSVEASVRCFRTPVPTERLRCLLRAFPLDCQAIPSLAQTVRQPQPLIEKFWLLLLLLRGLGRSPMGDGP